MNTCCVFPWLHPLKSWSLLETRGGSLSQKQHEVTQLDPDLIDLLKRFLEQSQLEPTVFRPTGEPVVVRGSMLLVINPEPVRRTLHDQDRQRPHKPVADVVRVAPVGTSKEDFEHASLAIRDAAAGPPPYLEVLSMPEQPDLSSTARGIYGIFVRLNSAGSVSQDSDVTLSVFRSDGDPFPKPSPEASLSAELRSWVRSLTFEPPRLQDGTQVDAVVLLEVEIKDSEAGLPQALILSKAELEPEEIKERVRSAYALATDQVLDLLPPPHRPERLLFYRFGSPAQASARPEGPSSMSIRVVDDEPAYGSSCFGCDELDHILWTLGFPDHRVIYEVDVPRIETDLIYRPDAEPEALLRDLSLALEEKLGLSLNFELREELSETVALSGVLGDVPWDDEFGGRVVHLYTDKKNDDPRSGGGGGPTDAPDILARFLEFSLDLPIEQNVNGPLEHPIFVRVHRSANRTTQRELLLKNLETQTDLTAEIVLRPQTHLIVSSR